MLVNVRFSSETLFGRSEDLTPRLSRKVPLSSVSWSQFLVLDLLLMIGKMIPPLESIQETFSLKREILVSYVVVDNFLNHSYSWQWDNHERLPFLHSQSSSRLHCLSFSLLYFDQKWHHLLSGEQQQFSLFYNSCQSSLLCFFKIIALFSLSCCSFFSDQHLLPPWLQRRRIFLSLCPLEKVILTR